MFVYQRVENWMFHNESNRDPKVWDLGIAQSMVLVDLVIWW